MLKEELIKLVEKIKKCEGTEEEIDDMIELLQPFSTKIPHENLAYPIIETDVFIPNRKH